MITNMAATKFVADVPFFYVQVAANDESEAQSFLEIAIRNFRLEGDHSLMLAHESPAENDEELAVFVFAVYGVKPPSDFDEADDLYSLYTIPHLVNRPCFDIDDYNDDTIIDTPAGKVIAEGY